MEFPYLKLRLQLDKVWDELHTENVAETNEQRIRHVYTMLKILVLVLRAMVEFTERGERAARLIAQIEDEINRKGQS